MFQNIRYFPDLREEFEAKAKELGAVRPRLSSRIERRNDSYWVKLTHQPPEGLRTLTEGGISYFPGCCGIKVIHDDSSHDPKWLKLITELRLRLVAGNCGLVVQTDVEGSEPTASVMRALKFTRIGDPFFNPNSGNDVQIYAKEVADSEEDDA